MFPVAAVLELVEVEARFCTCRVDIPVEAVNVPSGLIATCAHQLHP